MPTSRKTLDRAVIATAIVGLTASTIFNSKTTKTYSDTVTLTTDRECETVQDISSANGQTTVILNCKPQ